MRDELNALMASRGTHMAARLSEAGVEIPMIHIKAARLRRAVAGTVTAVVAIVTVGIGAAALANTDPLDPIAPSPSPSRSATPNVHPTPWVTPSPLSDIGEFSPTVLDLTVGTWSRPNDVEPTDVQNAWFTCGAPVTGLPAPGAVQRDDRSQAPVVEHALAKVYASQGTPVQVQGSAMIFEPVAAGRSSLEHYDRVAILTYAAWPSGAPESWGTRTYAAVMGSDGRVVALAYGAGEPGATVDLRAKNPTGPNLFAPDELMAAPGVSVWTAHTGENPCGSPTGDWFAPIGLAPWTIHTVTEVWVDTPGDVVALYVDTGDVHQVELEPAGVAPASDTAIKNLDLSSPQFLDASLEPFHGAAVGEPASECELAELDLAAGLDGLELLPIDVPRTLPEVQLASDVIPGAPGIPGLVVRESEVPAWWDGYNGTMFFHDTDGTLVSIARGGDALSGQRVLEEDMLADGSRFVPYAGVHLCDADVGAPTTPGTYRPVLVLQGQHGHEALTLPDVIDDEVSALWVELPAFVVD